MAVRSDRLFESAHTTTGLFTDYTTPSGERALIKDISVFCVNTGTFTMTTQVSASGRIIELVSQAMVAGQTFRITGAFIVLRAGDTLRTQSSVATGFRVYVSGAELVL